MTNLIKDVSSYRIVLPLSDLLENRRGFDGVGVLSPILNYKNYEKVNFLTYEQCPKDYGILYNL